MAIAMRTTLPDSEAIERLSRGGAR
jgi:hypothetical protein